MMLLFYGIFGFFAALILGIYFLLKKLKAKFNIQECCDNISTNLKLKLIFYVLFSTLSFSYLVLPERAGVSVPVFVLLQFSFLWFLVPDRKKLCWMIPIFLLSLNSFLSANDIWRPWNLILCMVLYCCMFTDFSLFEDRYIFPWETLTRFFSSFRHFQHPFSWVLILNKEKTPLIKRILVALIITVPSVILLALILSSADMVFQIKADSLLSSFKNAFSFNVVLKGVCGVLFSLFLFGILYQAHTCHFDPKYTHTNKKGDLIIINVLLCSILLVYTLFIVIQFRYLFAGAILPAGLSYTEYARKGFFELLALTGVNIAIILGVTKLTKQHSGTWYVFSKILCHYLCLVTIILLISSFYRMLLYTQDDGLTRLRFFVLGFLIFEAVGLIITFFYIAKPRFNLLSVYFTLALSYYVILNLIPVDSIVATNQINRYLKGDCNGISYVLTLSDDAIPPLKSLQKQIDDPLLEEHIGYFIQSESNIPNRWQRFNLSIEKAKR